MAKGLSGLPDDDLVCCGDRVAVLASVYEDGAGVTLLRYFQNTQHSLSFSGTHLSQQQPPRTPSQSSSAQGIPTQWTGQDSRHWLLLVVMWKGWVTRRQVHQWIFVSLIIEGKSMKEFNTKRNSSGSLSWRWVCCWLPIKTKMSLNHFYLSE